MMKKLNHIRKSGTCTNSPKSVTCSQISVRISSQISIIVIIITLLILGYPLNTLAAEKSPLVALLPEIQGWKLSEEPQPFLPGTLFEYINGAAEIYLSYDFQELIVGQYKIDKGRASLTIEIYDMSLGNNAFGIYGAERSPESRFIPVGVQGYYEEGALNFMTGKYYVKLLCYDYEAEAGDFLKSVSDEIVRKTGDKSSFPDLVRAFPREGLIPNSEKFILKNFLGYGFLHNGYLASYRTDEKDFDAFFIEGRDVGEAENMLKQYLLNLARNDQKAREIPSGYHLRDRYALNIFLGRAGNVVCGVMRLKDGQEETGTKYMELLLASLKKVM